MRRFVDFAVYQDMKKTELKKKKLVLATETVRVLQTQELDLVVGGLTYRCNLSHTCTNDCPTA